MTGSARWRRYAVLGWIALPLLQGGCVGRPSDPVRVRIPSGATMSEAAESLAVHGVVRTPALFRLWARFRKEDRKVKAGTYLLDRNASWNTTIAALVAGRGIVFPVTIPEGWEMKAILGTLAATLSLPVDSLEKAVHDSALIRQLGIPIASLEGYLFPETYLVPDGASATAVVRLLVNEFQRRWKPDWETRLGELGMTRHQIVTLASIIEREARIPAERPVISAVYHNRLKRGMLLQADPTIQYALGEHTRRVLYRDLRINSPYNTYRHPGLPPGPIASPGTASLEAALYPADVPWLYFVAHPDGHHEFRATLREHNEAVRRMRALRRTPGGP